MLRQSLDPSYRVICRSVFWLLLKIHYLKGHMLKRLNAQLQSWRLQYQGVIFTNFVLFFFTWNMCAQLPHGMSNKDINKDCFRWYLVLAGRSFQSEALDARAPWFVIQRALPPEVMLKFGRVASIVVLVNFRIDFYLSLLFRFRVGHSVSFLRK